MVFLDIGGVMYSDRRYRESLRNALRELGGEFSDEEFDTEYVACRRDQAGSFRRRLTERFLGDASRSPEVEKAASKHWRYQSDDLYPDVKPALEQLSKRYRLGVLANQPSSVRSALERDGIAGFFEMWGVSEDLGLSKPDPRLFEHALSAAGSCARCGSSAARRRTSLLRSSSRSPTR
jgi:FMN phosphatase YigB (HAD superfamily)